MRMREADSKGRVVISRYGSGGFRADGQHFPTSALLFDRSSLAVDVSILADLTSDHLSALWAAADELDLLLLGCGANIAAVPGWLSEQAQQAGLAVEPMDTAAACRTFNVLQVEGRRVAVILLPMGA